MDHIGVGVYGGLAAAAEFVLWEQSGSGSKEFSEGGICYGVSFVKCKLGLSMFEAASPQLVRLFFLLRSGIEETTLDVLSRRSAALESSFC